MRQIPKPPKRRPRYRPIEPEPYVPVQGLGRVLLVLVMMSPFIAMGIVLFLQWVNGGRP